MPANGQRDSHNSVWYETMKKSDDYLLKKRLECRNKGAEKFWEIEFYDDRILTRWGRLGGKPRENAKRYSSTKETIEAAIKLEKVKLDDGYVVVSVIAPGAKKRDTKKTAPKAVSEKAGKGRAKTPSKEERTKRASDLLRGIHDLINEKKLSEATKLSEFDRLISEFKALKIKYSEEDAGLVLDVLGQQRLPMDIAVHVLKSLMSLGVSKTVLRERVIDYFGYVASDISVYHKKPVRLNEKILPVVTEEFDLNDCESIALNLYVFDVISTVKTPLDKNYVSFLLKAGADPNFMAKTYSGGRAYRGYIDSPTELLGRSFKKRKEDAIMKLLLKYGGRIDDAINAGGNEKDLRALV